MDFGTPSVDDDYGEGDDRAVEIALEADQVVVQYRPALDPNGRHWDDAMRRLDGVQPFIDEEGWEALDEPVLVIGEDTDDETQWYVAPTGTANSGLVGRLRSLTLTEQASLYLASSTRQQGSFGVVTAALMLVAPELWPVLR